MRLGHALASLVFAATLAGCAEEPGGEAASRPTIVASAYPLAWAAARIAPDRLEVVDLVPPGVEPHDLELTPGDVEAVRAAAYVVYVGGGFQPAVEEAVAGRSRPSLDVLDEHEADPHVWLDPVRFRTAVLAMGSYLGAEERAAAAARGLEALHEEYARGLEDCERRTFVTAHAAFGRLAQRYGLTQRALTGVSPEAEPRPRELERSIREVRESGATTVFSEPLLSDRLARTVAREAGLRLGVLDPLEGLGEARARAGADYLSVMRDNLEALREALGCR